MDDIEIKLTVDERSRVLQAFSKVFQREIHNLSNNPSLLWQQLYNRLQWEEKGQFLKGILSEGYRNQKKPWLRINHPLRESENLIRTITGHTGEVSDCAFSPDGKVLASVSGDRTVRLWDVLSGEEKAIMTGHADQIYCCDCSPVDNLLVSGGGFDTNLRLWDIKNGQLKGLLTGHEDGVSCCAFSPDGQTIASGGLFKTLRFWDVVSGSEVKQLTNVGQVTHVAFSQDGKLIAYINSDNKSVQICFARNGRQKTVLSSQKAYYSCCSFSPDCRMLAAGNEVGQIELWDVKSKAIIMSLSCHDSPISDCSFSPDGNMLVTGGGDGIVKLWHVETGECLARFKGHSQLVSSCRFSLDGKMIVSTSYDQTIKTWHVDIGKRESGNEGHIDAIGDFVFTPDGNSALSMSQDETFRLWDTQTGKERSALVDWIDIHHSDEFAFNGQILACMGSDRIISLRDVFSEELLFQLDSHYDSMLSFSPDGKLIAANNWSEMCVGIWDIESRNKITSLRGHTDTLYSYHFSSDGGMIATSSSDGSVRVWVVETGEMIALFEDQSSTVYDCCFSPDNSRLAGACRDEILVWDINAQNLIYRIPCKENSVIALSYSTDGDHIIFAGEEWIQIVEVKTGDIKATMPRPVWGVTMVGNNSWNSSDVKSCALSPDGKLLAYARAEKILELWNLHTNQAVGAAVCLGRIQACRFSPFSNVIAVGDDGGNVYFLNLVGFDPFIN